MVAGAECFSGDVREKNTGVPLRRRGSWKSFVTDYPSLAPSPHTMPASPPATSKQGAGVIYLREGTLRISKLARRLRVLRSVRRSARQCPVGGDPWWRE